MDTSVEEIPPASIIAEVHSLIVQHGDYRRTTGQAKLASDVAAGMGSMKVNTCSSRDRNGGPDIWAFLSAWPHLVPHKSESVMLTSPVLSRAT